MNNGRKEKTAVGSGGQGENCAGIAPLNSHFTKNLVNSQASPRHVTVQKVGEMW